MARIERMTEEQAAALPAFREEWRAVGLSAAPMHEDAARLAVRDLYIASNIAPPLAIVALPSPMACLLARAIVNWLLRDQLGDQLGDQLRGQLGDQLYQSTFFIGGQDAFWLAFYEYGERIGVRYDEKTKNRLDAYRAYALTAGWLYPYKSIAFVSDRPAEIHFDAQRRLHNATGMAVKFRDGWGMHAWHGLRIPDQLIEQRDHITPDSIEAETNAELRRVALEIYGFDRYLSDREAIVVGSDELHGQPRRLLDVGIADERVRILEVVNGSLEPDGTRRKFHLGAMRGAETPHDAVAASYGIAPGRYREAVRT